MIAIFVWGGGLAGFNYRLTAETNKDEGLLFYFDDRSTRRANFRADAAIGLNDIVSFSTGQVAVDLDTGYGPTTTDPIAQGRRPHRTVASENLYAQVNWRHSFSDRVDLQARYSYGKQRQEDAYRFTESVPGLGVLSTVQDDGAQSSRHEYELLSTAIWDDRLRTVVGAGVRRDEISGVRTYGAGVIRQQEVSRLFGHMEWRFAPLWALNVGATYEKDSISGDSESPKIMLNYRFAPSQTLKLGYTRAARLPTLYESYANQELYNTTNVLPGKLLDVLARSSGTVGPERVVQQEVAYLGEFKQLNLVADVRAFDEKLSGWIAPLSRPIVAPAECELSGALASPPGCGNYDDFVNGINARIRGWEIQLTWTPLQQTRAILSYADVTIHTSKAIADAAGGLNSKVSYLSQSAPGDSWSLTLLQALPQNLKLSAAWYDVAGFKWTNATQVTRYQRLDWRLSYNFKMDRSLNGELAWTVRGDGGRHGEWHSTGAKDLNNEYVYPRHFLSLRLDY